MIVHDLTDAGAESEPEEKPAMGDRSGDWLYQRRPPARTLTPDDLRAFAWSLASKTKA